MSTITIKVGLNENKVPQTIHWSADDGGITDEDAKAMMLSMWDDKAKQAVRMDLWTTEMLVDEMKQFMHQTMLTMADSLERATGDKKLSGDMRDFCRYFAEKSDIIAPE